MRLLFPRRLAALSVLLFTAALRGQQAPETSPVTYDRDVAPILQQFCVSCHRPGGAAPFPLLTYEQARPHAGQISQATQRRFMPPWLPQAGYGDFADALRLSQRQLDLLADWARSGAPEGVTEGSSTPSAAVSEWPLGPPDMILKAQTPASVPAHGPDVFWNFIFSPTLTGARYVRAIEIRTGTSHAIHHANLYVDRTRSARRQERSPGEGFPGMDPIIERTALDFDDGHFLSWKPGMVPYVEPDGFSWRLDPGNDLLLNAHLPTTGMAEQVSPEVGIYFTDRPQTRFPMLIQLEHDDALKIPPNDPDFVITDSFRLPMDVDLLAIYPHAHYLGHLLESYATLPSGKRTWLIRIPNWDPNWQSVYRYHTPVFLPKGTLLSMRFHYDNSRANPRNPNHPPAWVYGGDQSTDEMGHLWLQVLPRGNGDRRAELELAFLQDRLKKHPNDFETLLHLGGIMLARFDAKGAVSMLSSAVRVNPGHAEAHNLLGTALQTLGRQEEAVEQFNAALHARADYVNARLNLSFALLKLHRLDEAIVQLRKVIEAYPEDKITKEQLADALAARANKLAYKASWTEAEQDLREAVALSPQSSQRHASLGHLLELRGKFAEAMEEYDRALAIDPSLEEIRQRQQQLRQLAGGLH